MEEEMLQKLCEIRRIMQVVGSRKAQTVGIIDDLVNNDFWWLCTALASDYFSGIIKDVRLFNISDIGTKKISSCNFHIFVHNGYNLKTFPSMRHRVELPSERKNLIIIIYNLEDSNDREKRRILQENGNCFRYKENIFLFSKKEQRCNYLSHLVKDQTPGSARSKKKKGFLSKFGTARRNLISINDYRQEPRTISYDSSKDMEREMPANSVKNKGSHRGFFSRFRSQSVGRRSSMKSNRRDYNHQEPQKMRYRNSAEKQNISSAHTDPSKNSGRIRKRPSVSKISWFGSVDRKKISSHYNHPEPQNASSSNSKGANVTPTGHRSDDIYQRSMINGHQVGIFSRSSDHDYSWLVEMLRSEDLRPHISVVRTWHLSKDTVREFLQEVNKCTFGILYQTQKMERNTVTSIKCDLELETLYSSLGKQNVAIIIDDLEDSSDRERSHILDAHPRAARWIGNLLLVPYLGKMEKKTIKRVTMELKMQLQGSDFIKYKPSATSSLRTFPTYGTGHEDLTSQGTDRKRHRVGIFSRSTEKEYSWLVETLRSEEFSPLVANVKCCFISNNQNFQEFLDDISQCTFGILYHSKNRGRVNVTNVTDSLYDQELETLHMIRGKKNILVVIDDLEMSDVSRKNGLLQEQHSIEKWAEDLMLFSENDKKDPRKKRKKTDQLKSLLRSAVPESAVSSCV